MKIVLATADSNLQLSLGLILSEEPAVNIVGTTSESQSLLALIKFTRPDIVMADWDLPGNPLSDLIKKARKKSDKPKWIILGPSARVREKALLAGASTFVVRGDPPEVLLRAFRHTRAQPGSSPDELPVTTKEE